MILDEIIENKRKEVEEKKKEISFNSMAEAVSSTPGTRDFKAAVSKPEKVNIIAEIKKTSPSRGIICRDFTPEKIAKIYETNNADAISVLTDKQYFGGDVSHLSAVSKIVKIPVLRKEFIIDEYQVYEARYFGANAVLLIAAVLEEREIVEFINLSSRLGMDCLVEVHTGEELKKALSAGADIIGINNRDLRDFTVDIQTTVELRDKIPAGKTVISESGISSADDMKLMKKHNVNAVLIGEGFLRENDIAEKMKELQVW